MLKLDITVAEMCAILDAPLVGAGAAVLRRKVNLCLDSREAGPGVVFWPLVGAKFDAHQFILQVMEKGALMSVMNEDQVQAIPVKVHVPVACTNDALLKLARGYQKRFKLRKIAVTGSNGKTTTKDMLRSVLAGRFNTLATEGNLNNQVGVPMTLFRLTHKHEAAVIEMGTNAPGEIKPLSVATEPDIAIITNVGYSHLEGLGSVQNVFKEKITITAGLKRGGVLIVNADDPQLAKLRSTIRYKVVTFGVQRGQFKPENVTWDANACAQFSIGRTQFQLHVPGLHNLYNALAVIAASTLLHVPKTTMVEGLSNFQASKMRMEIHRCKGFQVAADCYNANPSSMKMALETIGSVGNAGRRIAVLGDMLELGEQGASLHEEIGKRVPAMDFQILCTFGNLAKRIRTGAMLVGMSAEHALHFESRKDIVEFLTNELQQGDIVLVKGSRGMKLEEVVDDLRKLEPVEKIA